MIVVMEKEIPELFATAVLPDFPGCAVAGSNFGNHIEVLIEIPGDPIKAVLMIDRPQDGLVPLLDSLEIMEAQLNLYLDHKGMILGDGNKDWN